MGFGEDQMQGDWSPCHFSLTLQPSYLGRDLDGGLHGLLHAIRPIQTPDSSSHVQLGKKMAASA